MRAAALVGTLVMRRCRCSGRARTALGTPTPESSAGVPWRHRSSAMRGWVAGALPTTQPHEGRSALRHRPSGWRAYHFTYRTARAPRIAAELSLGVAAAT